MPKSISQGGIAGPDVAEKRLLLYAAYVKRKASGNVMLFPNKQSAKNYIRDYLEKEEE